MGIILKARDSWEPLELLKLLNGVFCGYEPRVPGRGGVAVTQLDVSGALAGLPKGAQAWAYLYANAYMARGDAIRALGPLAHATREALCADHVRPLTRTLDQLARGIAQSALVQSLRGRGECQKCVGYGVILGKTCEKCDGAGVVLVTEQERTDLSGLGLSRQAYMSKWAEYESVPAGVVSEWQELIRERMRDLVA